MPQKQRRPGCVEACPRVSTPGEEIQDLDVVSERFVLLPPFQLCVFDQFTRQSQREERKRIWSQSNISSEHFPDKFMLGLP